jgi:hypothetical protein
MAKFGINYNYIKALNGATLNSMVRISIYVKSDSTSQSGTKVSQDDCCTQPKLWGWEFQE